MEKGAKKRTQKVFQQMRLKEIREVRKLTQAALAKKLKVNQPAIAKLEKRTDIYISTLRHYIRATEGELQILAVYPDVSVEIKNFSKL